MNVVQAAIQILRDPASSTALTAIAIIVSIWMNKRTNQEQHRQLPQPRQAQRKRHHKRNKKRVVP